MPDTAPAMIRIDIVSDVVCPWCIIGYKQLERALAQVDFMAEIR
jgi:predicted DsbA family dithiol-disulfide isomerase